MAWALHDSTQITGFFISKYSRDHEAEHARDTLNESKDDADKRLLRYYCNVGTRSSLLKSNNMKHCLHKYAGSHMLSVAPKAIICNKIIRGVPLPGSPCWFVSWGLRTPWSSVLVALQEVNYTVGSDQYITGGDGKPLQKKKKKGKRAR